MKDTTADAIQKDLIALNHGINALRKTLESLVVNLNLYENAEALKAMMPRRESR